VPKPIAFMVMPFAVKKVPVQGAGVPTDVDFDRLWYEVHEPVLSKLGYQPVRADQDLGALIVVEMIQRLTIADLVVADVSLPNANVYYEIGVRHAAKRFGCVLVAASWAQPTFDLQQMRRLTYELTDGTVGDEAAALARRSLEAGMQQLVEGESPVFSAVPGYPTGVRHADVTAFREVVDALASFSAEVSQIGLLPADEQPDRAREVAARHGHRPALREAVALELIRLLRDRVGWSAMLDYIETLPAHLRRHPLVVEQRCIGLAKAGEPATAATLLERLIEAEGGTSERWGLLGGRYKELYSAAASASERRRFLDRAVDAYERGMRADLNDYYPTSNLARLYLARGRPGDERKAADAQAVTAAACERAIALGSADEWVRPTLLGLAFDRGDAERAHALLDEVEADGAPAWMRETTLSDLRISLGHQPEPARSQLADVLAALEGLVGERPTARVSGAPAAVVVSGHMVDAPDRPAARFPPSQVERVTSETAAALDRWGVDRSTTLVTGGARGADIIVAELAHERGAQIVMCLALPPSVFVDRSVALPGTDWSERFRALCEVAHVRVLEDSSASPDDEVFARANLWMLEVARGLGGPRPHAVLVWDGRSGDGPGGTHDLARRLGYTEPDERLVIIDPTPPS
jgi:hypothetical protein